MKKLVDADLYDLHELFHNNSDILYCNDASFLYLENSLNCLDAKWFIQICNIPSETVLDVVWMASAWKLVCCGITLRVFSRIGFHVFSLMLPCQCKRQCYELTFPLSVLMMSRCEHWTVLIAISNSNKCSKLKQAIEAILISIKSSLPENFQAVKDAKTYTLSCKWILRITGMDVWATAVMW